MNQTEIQERINELSEKIRNLLIEKHNLSIQIADGQQAERRVRSIDIDLGFMNGVIQTLEVIKSNLPEIGEDNVGLQIGAVA